MNKTMPTILLAAMALDLGGAETHTISLARELKRRGHEVIVASAGGRMVSMLNGTGIPHIQIPMDSRSPVVLFRAYRRLRSLLAEANVGLVHAHARIPAWLTSLAVASRPTPFVTTYHGVYNAGFPWKFLTRFGERTIAVSDDVQQHLVGRLGCPPGQIRVIPNGFDTNLFRPGLDIAPLLQEFGAEAVGPHVVHASRLSDHFADAAVALLNAMPLIDAQVPGARLWILGDGNRADEVRRLTAETNRRLGRQAAVATGARLDVPAFFNLADCVVAVARTAIEGMACGRPLVVAGEGGYRGILTPDKLTDWAQANFTAREGGRQLDTAEIAADVVRLIRPEAAGLRRELGEAGRQYVIDHYSIEAITTEILNVYAEVL
ncbi:MAG TPA: glycosyltransferase family 4 protein [Symbiobacteriaceae bacterium]|jgi:glycosyltransferase involved in cell wall biosynthesis|nr:glycosyltransferase family 4 protein [Symbiobacteriaceae bacterium]